MAVGTAFLAGVLAASAVAAALASGRGGSTPLAGVSATAKVACPAFSHSDLVCVSRDLVRVSGRRAEPVHHVRPGSKVAAKGVANKTALALVYLGQTAECDLLGGRQESAIVTRRPTGYLLTQLRGEALCTVGGKKIFVARDRRLPPRGLASAGGSKFVAILEKSGPNGPVQLRARFRPGASFSVAVYRGRLAVNVPTGRFTVSQGDELRIPANTLRRISTHAAHFEAGAKNVFARQLSLWFTLTVTVAGGSGRGTVVSTPSGIDCGDDCSERYASGTLVTVRAKSATQSSFAGWGGACAGTTTTCILTMDAPTSVRATFRRRSG
jgi:hypothetical protein